MSCLKTFSSSFRRMPESSQNKNAFVINPLDTDLHPQGVRRGCRGLKPRQHTQRRYDEKQKRAAPSGAVNHFQEEHVPRRI